MPLPHRSLLVAAMALAGLAGCESIVERPPPPESDGIHGFADGCYALDATRPGSRDTRWLVPTEDGAGFEFTARTLEEGSRFYLKAADLGAYLLRDADGQYLVAEDGPLLRQAELESDVSRMEDGYVSGAIWEMQVSAHDPERFQLRHRRSGRFLARAGLVEGEGDAGVVALYPREGCDPVPELTLDAEGEVAPRTFEDGSLYGIVETHAHLLTNLGFGGSGIFHGAPFHPLGVEHALQLLGRAPGVGLNSLRAEACVEVFRQPARVERARLGRRAGSRPPLWKSPYADGRTRAGSCV